MNRKAEKKKLDILWSKIIKLRAKERCERCGSTRTLNSHHIFARNSHSTRWDLRNGVCLCSSCHTFGVHAAHRDPSFKDWVVEHIGENTYNALRLLYYETWDKNIERVKTELEDEYCKY